MKKSVVIGAVSLLVLGASVYYFTQKPKPPTQPPPQQNQPQMKAVVPPAQTPEQTAELATGAADHAPANLTFHVNGGNFYYVPNEIRVKKGDTITVNFKNDGGFHDFNLDEFKVKIGPIKTGESGSATFIVDKTGSFEYYCSVGQHRQMGQKGTLIVE